MTRPSEFHVGIHGKSEVRPLRASDRAQLEEIIRSAANFTAEEADTALELIDDALAGDPDYIVNVVTNEAGEIAGYECHGPAALTEGTYDLYWIVVDSQKRRRSWGRQLLTAAEQDIVRRGGRLLVIETSSQPSYAATVEFYKRSGYRLEARIQNFYRPGDDKLILVKDLA